MRAPLAFFVPLLLLAALCACGPLRRGQLVDVNNARREALAELPGVGPDGADRIIANRPYLVKQDLRDRHVLTDAQYDAVADRLGVGTPGMADYLHPVPPQTP